MYVAHLHERVEADVLAAKVAELVRKVAPPLAAHVHAPLLAGADDPVVPVLRPGERLRRRRAAAAIGVVDEDGDLHRSGEEDEDREARVHLVAEESVS